ncbi:GNAT family N-acetyltransferase [Candidatus Latescibacterota bacterium]
MEKKIKIRKIIDDAFWDEFVSNSVHGTVFSTSAWLKASADAHGGEHKMLGVWEGDDLIAGVSFIEIVRGSLKKASNHVLTPYCGFIYKSDEDKLMLDTSSMQLFCAEKLIHYLQEKYNYVSLVHSPAFKDIRPFSWQNWDADVRYTYLINLSDFEEHWGNLKGKTRQQIKKAESTLDISGSISEEQIVDISEMISLERGQTPSVPKKTVVELIKNLRNEGLIDIISAREKSGELVSFQVVARDKNTVYLWMNGTIPEKKYTRGDSLMVWEVMKRYSETHKILDMVGANIPSVAYFKKSFGGTLTPYYVTERYSSTAAKTAFNTYTKVKRLFSR